MNLLQGIDQRHPLFVSLNPKRDIPDELVFDSRTFDHPVFDQAAIAAQVRIAGLAGSPRHLVRRRPSGPWLS